MGQGLPKAVESIVLERHGGPNFRVGLAEMNGWRPAMEDSHVIVARDSWGFFGVFDGHGGSQCSAFVAKRLTEELKSKPPPEDDAAMKKVMLGLDQEFLDSKTPSGSTGTFVLVKPAVDEQGRFQLRVGNIGDSRVLLGRVDGTIVEGPGTDGGLTTDHKPDLDSERQRIERTGGTVQLVTGVARVNGDLAVSRSFGDAPHKETGGPAQEDHPVSAEPEFTTLNCDATDFLLLVCDGISEGNFPNREVVQLVAEKLRQEGASADLGEVCAAVCRKALDAGSTDNLSCMIVLLNGGEVPGVARELWPGPFSAPQHGGFRRAYLSMAERAGCSLEEAVERRYDNLCKESEAVSKAQAAAFAASREPEAEPDSGQSVDSAATEITPAVPPEVRAELRAELALFNNGPSDSLAKGSPERSRWFREWLAGHEVQSPLDPTTMSRNQVLSLLARDPDMLETAKARGFISQDAMRNVQVATLENLKPAVEAHPVLKWDERLNAICGQQGTVLQDDPSDGTSQVQFPPPLTATAWLPTSALINLNGTEQEDAAQTMVRVAPESELRPLVEAHEALKWHDQMGSLCGQWGQVLQVDRNDGTSRVFFPPPMRITAWLPTKALTSDEGRHVRVPAIEQLRPVMDAHMALKWNDRLENICGQRGRVLQDDPEDGTSQVVFPHPISINAWLPTEVLIPDDGVVTVSAEEPPAEASSAEAKGATEPSEVGAAAAAAAAEAAAAPAAAAPAAAVAAAAEEGGGDEGPDAKRAKTS